MIKAGDRFDIKHEAAGSNAWLSGPYVCEKVKDGWVFYVEGDSMVKRPVQDCVKIDKTNGGW